MGSSQHRCPFVSTNGRTDRKPAFEEIHAEDCAQRNPSLRYSNYSEVRTNANQETALRGKSLQAAILGEALLGTRGPHRSIVNAERTKIQATDSDRSRFGQSRRPRAQQQPKKSDSTGLTGFGLGTSSTEPPSINGIASCHATPRIYFESNHLSPMSMDRGMGPWNRQ